jgi:dihydrofolate reductase
VYTSEGAIMSKVRFGVAMSLDGFIAGPQQSLENPLGVGGMQLHQWAFELEAFRRQHGMEGGVSNASTQIAEEAMRDAGAFVMGRHMFGGGEGAWDLAWTGWWGPNPPYHAPVFVLTHHPRPPLAMEGGTTFTFVTDGLDAALAAARKAAAGKDVILAGGASLIRQGLNAGVVDELNVSLVPLFLGSGEPLFAGLRPDLKIAQTRVIEAPGVTHLRYQVVRS